MAVSKSYILPAFYAGLLAGTLDLAGAIANFMISNGRFPKKILEYIASGALGKKAMDGSISSNLLGVFFHYFIAVSFAVFYFIIYPKLKSLHYNIIISSIIYGLFVWAITNMVVLPLSAIGSPVFPTDWGAAARAAFILIICIGLPVCWWAKKFYHK